ncbi:sensor histidine kinase [Streptomyces olivochromogenes]|uniref:sensor histidine kinase n=1 Tax=Streptomyces olivochromogenes TaxID=1963 RepID=UPI0036C5326E
MGLSGQRQTPSAGRVSVAHTCAQGRDMLVVGSDGPPSQMSANSWESLFDGVSTGIALVDGDGSIRWVNRSGACIMDRPQHDLAGLPAPFRLRSSAGMDSERREEPGEAVCVWSEGARGPRRLAYTEGVRIEMHRDGIVTPVSFRDVTEQQHHHRRVSALARTAATVASDSPLEKVLEAMAGEVQRSHGVAGTQIMTFAPQGDGLRLMGAAGFAEAERFFDLLMASRDRGADLATHRSMSERTQYVVPGRRAQMLADPAWEPLHTYVSQLDWDDFVSTPLLSRGQALGALNVYVASSFQATPAMLDFLSSMAEQAALAVDYATLIHQGRLSARSEERARLARDLHDSVVQHVFSIGMQAKSVQGIARRLSGPYEERLTTVAAEVTDLVDSVQRDLRGVILALQPPVSAKIGLLPALNALAEGIERRYDVTVDLDIEALVDGGAGDADLREDVYRIVSEALHNAVKHAAPTIVQVVAEVDRERGVVRIDVIDNGRGVTAAGADGSNGFGLVSMRDRASRWGGHVVLTAAHAGSGTRVRIELPTTSSRTDQERADSA